MRKYVGAGSVITAGVLIIASGQQLGWVAVVLGVIYGINEWRREART